MKEVIVRTGAQAENQEGEIQTLYTQIRTLKAQKQAAISTLAGQNLKIVKLYKERAEDQEKRFSDWGKSEILRLKAENLILYNDNLECQGDLNKRTKTISEKNTCIAEQSSRIKECEGMLRLEAENLAIVRKALRHATERIHQQQRYVIATGILQHELDDANGSIADHELRLSRVRSENLRLCGLLQRVQRHERRQEASDMGRRGERWAESDDEGYDEEATGLEDCAVAVHTLLRESFAHI